MTEIKEVLPNICPLCGNQFTNDSLTQWNLTEEIISKIQELLEQGNFIVVLELGMLAAKLLDPDKFNITAQLNEALKELIKTANKNNQDTNKEISKQQEIYEKERLLKQEEILKNTIERKAEIQELLTELEKLSAQFNSISEKIVEPTKRGDIGEIIVIKDLKSAVPTDEFDDTKASKHGPDIIGIVKRNGTPLGKVVISVKNTQSWSTEFIEQAKRNCKAENTHWVILASKTFPNEALNQKIYFYNEKIILVKPEYTSLVYMGIREAVIYWYDACKLIDQKITEQEIVQHSVRALRDWVDSIKFKEFIELLEGIKKLSKDTDEVLEHVANHIEKKVKKAKTLQEQIRNKLINCNSLLSDLQKVLKEINAEGNSEECNHM